MAHTARLRNRRKRIVTCLSADVHRRARARARARVCACVCAYVCVRACVCVKSMRLVTAFARLNIDAYKVLI